MNLQFEYHICEEIHTPHEGNCKYEWNDDLGYGIPTCSVLIPGEDVYNNIEDANEALEKKLKEVFTENTPRFYAFQGKRIESSNSYIKDGLEHRIAIGEYHKGTLRLAYF